MIRLRHPSASPVCLLVAVLAFSHPAWSADADEVRAEEAFAQGKSLADSNDMPAACRAFSESYRLAPALGTLLNLAWCHESIGKTSLALAEYERARAESERSGQEKRRRFAQARIDALRAIVPFLLVELAPADQHAVVRLDGVPVDPGTLRSPIPVDPGSHRLEVQARGRSSFLRDLSLPAEGGITRVLVPKLTSPAVPDSNPRPDPRSGTPSRTLGILVGSVGIAAVGVGGYFGIRTFSLKSDADHHCSGGYCDDTGLDLDKDAKRSATLSTIGFLAGGVAIGAGAWLFLKPPASSKYRLGAGVAPGGGQVAVTGRF